MSYVQFLLAEDEDVMKVRRMAPHLPNLGGPYCPNLITPTWREAPDEAESRGSMAPSAAPSQVASKDDLPTPRSGRSSRSSVSQPTAKWARSEPPSKKRQLSKTRKEYSPARRSRSESPAMKRERAVSKDQRNSKDPVAKRRAAAAATDPDVEAIDEALQRNQEAGVRRRRRLAKLIQCRVGRTRRLRF